METFQEEWEGVEHTFFPWNFLIKLNVFPSTHQNKFVCIIEAFFFLCSLHHIIVVHGTWWLFNNHIFPSRWRACTEKKELYTKYQKKELPCHFVYSFYFPSLKWLQREKKMCSKLSHHDATSQKKRAFLGEKHKNA